MFKKSKLLLFVVVLMVTALVVGSAAAETKKKVEKQITLMFWQHEDPALKKATEKIIADFEAENPDIKVDYLTAPYTDYITKVMTAVSTGKGPDIFDIGDWDVPTYVSKGLVAPLDPSALGYASVEKLEKDWLNGSLEGFKFGGKIYGVPIEFNTFSLFINPEHFREAGLDPEKDYPKTWKEVGQVSEKLKIIENGVWTREGFDIPYHDPVWTMIDFAPILAQAGGSILSKDGKKCLINSPEALKAFKVYTGLITEYKTGNPNVGQNSSAQPNYDFASGELSMWIIGPWAPSTFAGTPLEDSYMVVPLPQLDDGVREATTVYSLGWMVNAKSKVKDAAYKFLNYSTKQQKYWLQNVGYIQPRLGWLDSSEAKQKPYLDVFINDMKKGKYMVRTVNFQEIGAALHRAVERTVLQGMDPKESLNTAKEEIDEVLK